MIGATMSQVRSANYEPHRSISRYAKAPAFQYPPQVNPCGGETMFAAPMEGYLLALLSAFCSASAGVYTEFLLKRNDDSLYWQNIQLYVCGVIFNIVGLSMRDFQVEECGAGHQSWLVASLVLTVLIESDNPLAEQL